MVFTMIVPFREQKIVSDSVVRDLFMVANNVIA